MTKKEPSKQRTTRQRIGREGEDLFQLFGSNHRLLATVPRDDFGFDFLCQVEAAGPGDAREITGDFVGVCVRSTNAKRPRVKLSRSDAESMLRAKFVVCFALVWLGSGEGRVFHRFLDEDFANQLTDFLSSDQSTLTLTPAQCAEEASFNSHLKAALQGNYPERVRLAVARRQLSVHLPNPNLEVRRTAEGELTILEVGNFHDFFVGAGSPRRDAAYHAIFGSPTLRLDRLAKVGPRPEVATALQRLPSPLLLGLTQESEIVVVAENAHGKDSASFTYVSTSTHSGWVHDGGFSITISSATRHEDQWVHEIDAVIDPDVRLNLADYPSLWSFLERCTDDAVLYPEDQPKLRLDVATIRGLRNAHFFARFLRAADTLAGWDSSHAHLRVATDDESLHTMALLAEAATHPQFLEKFGFVLEGSGPRSDYVEVPASVAVPVVASLGDRGLVCWFETEAASLTINGTAHGIRFGHIRHVAVDMIDRLDKATQFPEIVTDRTWPTIALTPDGPAPSESDARHWKLELRESAS